MSDQEEEEVNFKVDYINFKDKSSRTALQYAAYKGDLRIVRALVEAGAEVDTKNSKHITPILNAASRGHLEVVKYLHEKGGNLSGKINKQRKSALIQASANGHIHVVDWLLKNNLSSWKEADTSGNTALHYAAAYGWPQIVKLLLASGADPNLQNLWNTTPASLAIQKCHYQILDIILNNAPPIIVPGAMDLDGREQPFLSDAQGRDLVSQHLLSFDKNTIDHFKTLTQLFKRLKIEPKNSTDNSGFNAYHYLASFSMPDIARDLANKDISDDEEAGEIDYEDDYSYDEDELLQDRRERARASKKKEADMKDAEGLSKEILKQIKKYQEISANVIEIAETLLKWGYDWEARALDGCSPIMVAAQCNNLPLIEWLMNKGTPIARVSAVDSNKNFLHHLFIMILEFNMRNQLDSEQLLTLVFKKYSHNDYLFALAQEADTKGFTPLLGAMCKALSMVYRDKYSCTDDDQVGRQLLVSRIGSIVSFLQKIGHKFGEVVPQERELDNLYRPVYDLTQEMDCERSYDMRKKAYQRATNTKFTAEDAKVHDAYGVIQTIYPLERETNHYNKCNWLHFFSQIIALLGKDVDVTPLINIVNNFHQQARESLRAQILAQSQLSESPFTNSYHFEPLFKEYLKFLHPQDLKQNVVGLFRNGTLQLIHLCFYIRSQEGVNELLQLLHKDKSLLQARDTFGNTLLHYAAFNRNLRLTQEILTNFAGLLFNSEGEVLENAKGNTPLHLAVVIMRSNLLELPKIEMQLIHAKGSLLLHKNRKGFNPLHLTLMNGSQYNSDPINAVKLMLDNPYSNQLIRQTDSLGNLPIHIAARLPNIPLSLSIVFQKTTPELRNSANGFGNSPLAIALQSKQTSNALFIMQTSAGDQQAIQENVLIFKKYFEIFRSLNGILTEQMNDDSIESVESFALIQKQNIHTMALSQNFFGLYHFSDPTKPLPFLIGAIQSKNFTLFLQLCENYSKQQLSARNPSDGATLLHALASVFVKSPNQESPKKNGEAEEEEDYGNEYDEEEDDERDKGSIVAAGDQEVAQFREIFKVLTETYQIQLDAADNAGRIPLHYAAKSKNLLFFENAFELFSKTGGKKVFELLNTKDKTSNITFLSELLLSKYNHPEGIKLKIFKLVKELLGAKLLQNIDLSYTISRDEIETEAKRVALLFDQTLRERILLSCDKFRKDGILNLCSTFDVVECGNTKIIQFMLANGFQFDQLEPISETTPFLWACHQRDLPTVGALLGEKIVAKVGKKEFQRAVEILSEPLQGGCISYSRSILDYLKLIKVIDQRAGKDIKYFEERPISKPAGGLAALCKHQEKVDLEFQKAIMHFNSQSKKGIAKPNLIDKVSEMQNTHEIYKEVQDGIHHQVVEYSLVMMKVDINKGSYFGIMRYYIMQLLKEKKNGYLTLWTRWGRLGERGQNQNTPFRLEEKGAIKEFEKLFKQKAGMLWQSFNAIGPDEKLPYVPDKYRVVMFGNRNADKRIMSAYQAFNKVLNINSVNQSLEQDLANSGPSLAEDTLIKKSVIEIMTRFFNKTAQTDYYRLGDENKNSRLLNMALTTDQITEAQQLLSELLEKVVQLKKLKKEKKFDEVKALYNQMIDMNNAYYSLIPSQDYSYSAAQELTEEYEIKQEIETLQELYDFSRTLKISLGSLINKRPVQYIKESLPIKIERLNTAIQGHKLQHDLIMYYINQSMPAKKGEEDNNFVVTNIFKLQEDDLHREVKDQEVFSHLHNHWMLWHGTKNKNIMSILLKGLKIKPPNATHTGSLFGDAIYFADKFTKSLDYTSRPQRYRKKEGNTFYMLLCEVALGNIANFTESWKDETYRPPKDHHSIRVMGKEGPDFYHSIMTPDYQVYPVGPIVVYPKVQFEKGTKLYGGKQFFAEYLRKKKEQLLKDAAEEVAKAQKAKKKGGDIEMIDADGAGDSESEEKDPDEQEDIEEDERKQLEKSFMHFKERKYMIEPNIINAEYCKNRLERQAENFNEDYVYANDSEYMIYSENQVRIRYLVEFKML